MKKYYKIMIAVSLILVGIFIFIPENEEIPDDSLNISALTVSERLNYFASHGWEVEELFSKSTVIPENFSNEYEQYVCIQDLQKLPLRQFVGKEAEVFTYKITNYSPEDRELYGEIIVSENVIVASLIYDISDSTYLLSVH